MLNYNGLKYLKRTIPSYLKLNYPNYEFIIVDNGSTDGSLDYINSINSLKLIKSPKLREKNFACNYGIKRAKGKYILLLDNDALNNDEDILKNLYSDYISYENIGVLGTAHYDEGQKLSCSYGVDLSYSFAKSRKLIPINEVINYNGSYIGYPSGLAFFIEKKKWKKVGGYDDFLKFGGDDNDLGIKLWLLGYKNYLYSKSLFTHIGIQERFDLDKYLLKWEEVFFAELYTIFKNYGFFNMIISLFFRSCIIFYKSMKLVFQRKSIKFIFAYFFGLTLFIKSLPIAIKKRKKIQSLRVIKNDIFLKIKPPEIY